MKKRIAVLISGSGSNLQAIIDAISAKQINGEIVLVISNKSEAYGLQRAQHANIETQVLQHTDYDSREAFDKDLSIALIDSKADLIVLAGFMRILTEQFVNQFKDKMLNIHPSLLPKYKGLNTHQRAIDAKDPQAGCSVHYVTAELDDGPIAMQGVTAIEATDDAEALAQKVHRLEHIIYPKVVSWICDDQLKSIDNRLYFNSELLDETGFKLSLDDAQ